MFQTLHHRKITQKPVVSSFINKISKFQGRFPSKHTLIGAVLPQSNSQSAKPSLKSPLHLTACRYQAFFFFLNKSEMLVEFLEVFGIFFGVFFLWFSFIGFPATQNLAFPSPRDRKVYDNSRRHHISSV